MIHASHQLTRRHAPGIAAAAVAGSLVLWATAAAPAPAATGGATVSAALPAPAQQAFDISNLHSSTQSTIVSANIAQLHIAWTLPTKTPVSHTPLVDNGRLYFGDWGGNAYAVDVRTGRILWQKHLQDPRTDWAWYGFAGTGALGQGMLFEASSEGNAYALDTNTGDVKWQTHFADHPNGGNVGTLLYHNGLVYIGVSSVEEGLALKPGFKPTFRGSVMALDANTGKTVWQRFLVDAPQNGVAVWSGLALDPAMNALFFSTGNNYTGDESPLADAVVAVRANTGEILWAKQAMNNDIWTLANQLGPDWDFSGGPQLFTATINGQMRQLVGAAQKSGTYWAFDRNNGEVVWRTGISNGGTLGGIEGEVSIGPDRILAWGNEAYSGGPPDQHPMNIKALDPATGKILWAVPKAQPAVLKAPGFLANDVFLIGSLDGRVRAYRTTDGQLLWISMPHGSIASGLLVQGDSLFFTTGVPKIFGDNGLGSGVVVYTTNPQVAPGGVPPATPGTNPAPATGTRPGGATTY